MLGGKGFVCPQTGRNVAAKSYAMDHIIPFSVCPTNESWNLIPSDSCLNSHTKRVRTPTVPRMVTASPRLARTCGLYMGSTVLGQALRSDLRERFTLAPNANPSVRRSGHPPRRSSPGCVR